ncbi:alpha/beta hydrolase [Maricurvus nonylphenolicus]|uniref:alpha/beta hydrolase n=1 Tax=Maricurvus nonylphenolicus TaxID=1008307 RepID=UPI0036F3A94E
MIKHVIKTIGTAILCLPVLSLAAVTFPEVVLPDSVERSAIKIWSDGRALDADIYRPKQLDVADKAPAIVTSHGWGGSKETAARYAAKFSEQGFIVVTFTHSTWGESQGNLILEVSPLQLDAEGNAEAKVHVVRNLVDPIDWVQNVRAAVDYLEGEPNVDSQRIGVWGTSFGGGVVLTAAANDDRISAMVTQVGAFPVASGPTLAHAKQRAIDIARGKLPPIPENLDGFPGLDGYPNLARFVQYNPIKAVSDIHIPTMIITAENEQFFKNEEHSDDVYAKLKGRADLPTHYKLIKGIDHYGIYFDGYQEGSDLALKWFNEHLK